MKKSPATRKRIWRVTLPAHHAKGFGESFMEVFRLGNSSARSLALWFGGLGKNCILSQPLATLESSGNLLGCAASRRGDDTGSLLQLFPACGPICRSGAAHHG